MTTAGAQRFAPSSATDGPPGGSATPVVSLTLVESQTNEETMEQPPRPLTTTTITHKAAFTLSAIALIVVFALGGGLGVWLGLGGAAAGGHSIRDATSVAASFEPRPMAVSNIAGGQRDDEAGTHEPSSIAKHGSIGLARFSSGVVPIVQRPATTKGRIVRGTTSDGTSNVDEGSMPMDPSREDLSVNAVAADRANTLQPSQQPQQQRQQLAFGSETPAYPRLGAVMPKSGQLTVLARARNSPRLYAQTFLAEGRFWHLSGWEQLGMDLKGGPSAAIEGPDTILVAVRGVDDRIWFARRSGGWWGTWSVISSGTVSSSPAVVASGRKFLFVFARAGGVSGGGLVIAMSIDAGSSWTWFSLGGSIKAGSTPSAVVASSQATGVAAIVDVMVQSPDDRVRHLRLRVPEEGTEKAGAANQPEVPEGVGESSSASGPRLMVVSPWRAVGTLGTTSASPALDASAWPESLSLVMRAQDGATYWTASTVELPQSRNGAMRLSDRWRSWNAGFESSPVSASRSGSGELCLVGINSRGEVSVLHDNPEVRHNRDRIAGATGNGSGDGGSSDSRLNTLSWVALTRLPVDPDPEGAGAAPGSNATEAPDLPMAMFGPSSLQPWPVVPLPKPGAATDRKAADAENENHSNSGSDKGPFPSHAQDREEADQRGHRQCIDCSSCRYYDNACWASCSLGCTGPEHSTNDSSVPPCIVVGDRVERSAAWASCALLWGACGSSTQAGSSASADPKDSGGFANEDVERPRSQQVAEQRQISPSLLPPPRQAHSSGAGSPGNLDADQLKELQPFAGDSARCEGRVAKFCEDAIWRIDMYQITSADYRESCGELVYGGSNRCSQGFSYTLFRSLSKSSCSSAATELYHNLAPHKADEDAHDDDRSSHSKARSEDKPTGNMNPRGQEPQSTNKADSAGDGVVDAAITIEWKKP